MVRGVFVHVAFCALFLMALPLEAATVGGQVTDATGAAVPGARVVLRGVATGEERVTESDTGGRFSIDTPATGAYLVIVRRAGFSEAARTVVVMAAEETLDVQVQLHLGGVTAEVTVTAARAERESRQIPLHVESLAGESTRQTNPLSTGDALSSIANVTPVGNGPFGVRPRLRGLDSTRLLVLVDGERLNTARQATDRTGAEVGLITPDAISRVEIVNGAGTLLYGSDALAGTINIITNEPTFSDRVLALYGFNGYYSSNENGRRATATVGVSAPRYAVRLQTGAEDFDNYTAGALSVEDTRPMFVDGRLRRVDTIDDGFGFTLAAFPDPFNAPYVRTSREVASSGANGRFVNLSGVVRVGERRTLRMRYQSRRMEDVGFPDFAQPYFFNATSLPHSDLDRASARYEAQAVTPWLANLSVTAHYQRTDRLLQNLLPVQFPAPTPVAFFPITVFRLDILSRTQQRVWSPGVDVQAVFTPVARHVVTTGLTFYRDRSSDLRTTSTTTSMVGQVALGARGPAAVVLPSLVQLGPAAEARPVRVPDAALRDIAMFVQDEWQVLSRVSLVAGLRGDFYRVTSEATPGYDVSAVVAGARPAIDPATLPSASGTTLGRKALTGDIGVVANAGGRVSPFVRFGRSYRHPNLEEMFYAGPATAGNIAPNINVKPETGNNVDVGVKMDLRRFSGGTYLFMNQYKNFIAQDLVAAATPAGPLVQTTNYADVRIHGLELAGTAPVVSPHGVITLSASAALTRGTITEGVDPFTGLPLDDAPADNITPVKVLATARFTELRGRWWAEYGIRTQTDVTRVTPTLLSTPFRIAQDFLSLDGFVVQRLGWGVDVSRGRNRLALVFAVENLANRYYREHFQFAPARGRSFTIGLSAGAMESR
jgi:outer membrane receptor protein involved in Fe transport